VETCRQYHVAAARVVPSTSPVTRLTRHGGQSVEAGRAAPKRSPVTGSRYSFELLPCDEWKSNRFFNVPLMASNDPAIRGRLQLSSMSAVPMAASEAGGKWCGLVVEASYWNGS
jgi:hypothetical protein